VSRGLIWLSLALLAVRVLSAAFVVVQPGFTDAYYYVDVARRLAHGQGLTADFIWNFLEAPHLDPLPVASHRFWMPLATVVQAAGIAVLEPLLGTFRSAQAAIIIVAAFVPAGAYAAARSIGASSRAALFGAALAGIGGGAFAPAWVTLDSFAIAALVGTLFFLAYARAANGDARAGAVAGALVGALFLARAEGALFGVALLALAIRPGSRAAGVAGSAVALAIGGAWLARGVALGASPDLLGRTVLLARYEDFFAIDPTGTADLVTILTTRLGALWSDFVVALFGLMAFLAFPLALGVRGAWHNAAVRAFVGLALLIYVAESAVWTLHATRGSYFHSLAAFYPFAMALVALGGETWLASRDERTRRLATTATLAAALALAAVGLTSWDGAFNAGYRVRLDAVDAIPAGPFLAIDGAAWRWIADRPALVTPADGTAAAACVAARYGAKSVVLEATHFSAYDRLYRGEGVPWLGPPIDRGGIRIYPVRGDIETLCRGRASPDTDRTTAVP
jgi:hypothetical protein